VSPSPSSAPRRRPRPAPRGKPRSHRCLPGAMHTPCRNAQGKIRCSLPGSCSMGPRNNTSALSPVSSQMPKSRCLQSSLLRNLQGKIFPCFSVSGSPGQPMKLCELKPQDSNLNLHCHMVLSIPGSKCPLLIRTPAIVLEPPLMTLS
jgi:hypothetical protein